MERQGNGPSEIVQMVAILNPLNDKITIIRRLGRLNGNVDLLPRFPASDPTDSESQSPKIKSSSFASVRSHPEPVFPADAFSKSKSKVKAVEQTQQKFGPPPQALTTQLRLYSPHPQRQN